MFSSVSLLIVVLLIKVSHAAPCSTKFSDATFLSDFGFTATSETSKNTASDVFTVGWCASTNSGSPHLDVDFKLPYGISAISVSGPTNRDGNPYPTNVLVKYVPNGGDANNFVHFPLQQGKLEIKLTQPGTVQTNFGQGLAARKLRFTIQSFHGDACLKIDLIGCTINELCTGGCQQNGGVCIMQDTCQCPQGTLGDNCGLKACVPADLGLADGRIGADHVTVSSQDPIYNKAEIGNSGSKKGWCPFVTDHSPWVQITLDQPKAVSVFNFMWSGQGGQTILTEFELQYIAAIDSTRRFRTFATDIPAMNNTHIFTVTIQPVVVTDTIRIIPSKWDNSPCFKLEIQGCDPKALCSTGWCMNGGTCMGENVCVCPAGFVGRRCEQKANEIKVSNMTFVNIENNIIVTTTANLQFHVTGSVNLEVIANRPVVTITGTNSCITLKQTTGTPSCVTDVNQCTNGFTFTVDVNFGQLLDNTYIVSSGGNLPDHSGIVLFYYNKQLHYIVSTTTQTWTVVVNYPPVLHQWQHFELTWNKYLGIEILVNGHALGSNSQPAGKPTSSKSVNLALGCSHTSTNVNTNMQITAINLWPFDRTELVNAGIKYPPATTAAPVSTAATSTVPVTKSSPTSPPLYLLYNLTFLSIINNVLTTPTFNFTLHNKPTLELQNNRHSDVVLDCSKQQYAELPDQGIPCLQNVVDCRKGFTFTFEILFTKLEPAKKMYILSSGGDVAGTSGMAIYIQTYQLIFGVKQGFQHWTGRYDMTGVVKTNKWYKLEVSWSAEKGILVIVDGYEVIKTNKWTPSPINDKTNPVLIGKTEGSNDTSCMKVRDLFAWTTHREVLVDQGIVKPLVSSQPTRTSTTPETTTVTSTPTEAFTSTDKAQTTEGMTTKSSTPYMYSEASMSLKPTTATTSSVQQWQFEDAIRAVCTSSGWNISMDLHILQQLYPNITTSDIYLSPAKCHGTRYNNKLWFQQSFDSCMTTEKDVDGTTLFQNTLFYAIFDSVDPTIVRRHMWTYNVACYLSKQESSSAHLHHDVESHSTNITGHHDIALTFFRDQNFLHQITGDPLSVSVGDNIYVRVATAIPDWDTKLRLHTCYTRPSDKALEHLLIRDGCEVDSSTHIISQSTHETKFVFRDFEYLTLNEGLDIFCNATFCGSGDYSPTCTQACRQDPSFVG